MAFLTIGSGLQAAISSWTYTRNVDLQVQPLNPPEAQSFDWSPDGSFVVYVAGNQANEIRVILAAGGELGQTVPQPTRLAPLISSSGAVVRWAWRE